MKSDVLLTASTLFALTLIGCGEEERERPEPTVNQTGRGSTTCHAWQQSLCVYSEKCGVTVKAECLRQSTAIACKSDDLARQCTESLNAATCSNPPQGCDARDMADPEPAIAACHDLASAVCNADHRCGRNDSAETCTTELIATYECERSLGARLELENCIAALDALSCSAPAPGNCNGVILR